MPFTTVTVTATILEHDNVTPARGHIDFQLTNDMADGVGGRILARATKRAKLDSNGQIEVELAATDDASTSPQGTLYLVTESIVGAPTRTYHIEVPAASPTLDLATVSPTAPGAVYVAGPPGPTGPQGPAGPTGPGGADPNAIHTTGDESAAGTKTWTGAQRVKHIETRLDVLAFGGVSSIAETTATFQAAAAEWNNGGELNFPPERDFTVNARIPLPTRSTSDFYRYTLKGRGCKIRAATGYTGPVIGHDMPANEAGIIRGQVFDFSGLDLMGSAQDSLRGQVLLRVVGGQNVIVHHCGFKYADVGIDIVAALNTEISNNESKFCYSYPYLIRSGLSVPLRDGGTLAGISGATVAGTAPNVTKLTKNRSFAYTGTVAQFACYGGDGFKLEGNTGEGFNPVYNILHDNQGHTSGRVFHVDGHHFENNPTGALVKLLPYTGHCIIDATWPNSATSLFLDTSGNTYGSATTSCVIVRIGTILVTPSFKTDLNGPRFLFIVPGLNGNANVAASGNWVGAVTPTSIGVERFAGTGEDELSGFGFGLAGSRLFMHSTGQLMLKSDGAMDGNWGIMLKGRTVQKVAGGAVPGVFVPENNMIALDADEATNEIVVTWKKNDGSVRFGRLATLP